MHPDGRESYLRSSLFFCLFFCRAPAWYSPLMNQGDFWLRPQRDFQRRYQCASTDRKHRGYKPPDSFRKQTQNREINNLYPMKLAPRIYPWGQCFNSLISNLKSQIDWPKASRIQAPGFIPKADSGPRNKKPVSDETCPPNLSVGSMLQSKI
jgi:hypothetical protein